MESADTLLYANPDNLPHRYVVSYALVGIVLVRNVDSLLPG